MEQSRGGVAGRSGRRRVKIGGRSSIGSPDCDQRQREGGAKLERPTNMLIRSPLPSSRLVPVLFTDRLLYCRDGPCGLIANTRPATHKHHAVFGYSPDAKNTARRSDQRAELCVFSELLVNRRERNCGMGRSFVSVAACIACMVRESRRRRRPRHDLPPPPRSSFRSVR